jgi:hypothetical protein
MPALERSRWQQLWLCRPWHIEAEPSTGLLAANGVRGYLLPGDVEFLWQLALTLPPAGSYLEVGSWMGLSSIVVANAVIGQCELPRHPLLRRHLAAPPNTCISPKSKETISTRRSSTTWPPRKSPHWCNHDVGRASKSRDNGPDRHSI